MQDPRQLIVSAFQQAQRSGNPRWRRMTVAVLKNRLLDLTERQFSEADYGASNLLEFVSRYSDLLRVDHSEFPPIVELYGAEADKLSAAIPSAAHAAYRIRADLWQAALDYSSGAQYVWDADVQEARPGQDYETAPVIDTITADIQDEWRQEFLDETKRTLRLAETEVRQCNEWMSLRLGTSQLPPLLIPRWNRFFRDKVLDHLRNWFSGAGIAPPTDFVSSAPQHVTKRSAETESLRELVMSVVRHMTHDELSEIKLSGEAVLRATRRNRQ